jgi:phosphoserine phosphatase
VQERFELGLEGGVGLRGLVFRRQLVDRGDERFGHVAPAEVAEERTVLVAQAGHDRLEECVQSGYRVVVTSASPTRTTSAPASR